MRPQEMRSGLFRQSLGYLVNGQPGGVGADDGARLDDSFDFLQQVRLYLQILRHHLNDPVCVGQPAQVVLEVSHRDEFKIRRTEEGRWAGHDSPVYAHLGQLVPEFRRLPGQAFLDILLVEVLRHDVQQIGRYVHSSQQGGNLAAHDAGTKNSGLSDRHLSFSHGASVGVDLGTRTDAACAVCGKRRECNARPTVSSFTIPPSRVLLAAWSRAPGIHPQTQGLSDAS